MARNPSKKQNAKHLIVLVSSCWLAAALARRLDDLVGWFGGMGTWVQVAGLRWMSWCAGGFGGSLALTHIQTQVLAFHWQRVAIATEWARKHGQENGHGARIGSREEPRSQVQKGAKRTDVPYTKPDSHARGQAKRTDASTTHSREHNWATERRRNRQKQQMQNKGTARRGRIRARATYPRWSRGRKRRNGPSGPTCPARYRGRKRGS